MIKFSLIVLEETAKSRPAGYLKEVCAAGRIEAGYVWLSDSAYAELRARFNSACVPPVAVESRRRFEVCKACDHARNAAFDCALHKGCCFGRWRSNAANKCPKGKW